METPRRSRRHVRLAAVAALALALTALAPVAQADEEIEIQSSSQCASGRFCIWSGANYTGSFWSTASVGLQDTGMGVAQSVWNRMAVDVRLYSGSGGTGTVRCWNNGQQNGSVTVGSASIRTMTATTC